MDFGLGPHGPLSQLNDLEPCKSRTFKQDAWCRVSAKNISGLIGYCFLHYLRLVRLFLHIGTKQGIGSIPPKRPPMKSQAYRLDRCSNAEDLHCGQRGSWIRSTQWITGNGGRASGLLSWCRGQSIFLSECELRSLDFYERGSPCRLECWRLTQRPEDITEAVPLEVILEDIVESLDLQHIDIIT